MELKPNTNVDADQPVQSKFTRLHESIDAARARAQKGIQKPGPFGPYKLIHRVRNEHTEKDLPEGKFCDGEFPEIDEFASVLDKDVTCHGCLKTIYEYKFEGLMADPDPKAEAEFAAGLEAGAAEVQAKNDAQDDQPETEQEPVSPHEQKFDSEFIKKLDQYRQDELFIMQNQVDVIFDISESLQGIKKTLDKMDIRQELVWMWGKKEINRDV